MKSKAILVILPLLFVFLAPDIAAHPATGIVLDRTGNVYFSDLETIWKIDLNGKLSVFRAGVNGRHVHELAIDDQDNIYGEDLSYVSQKFVSSVWRMTTDGKFEYLLEPTDTKPPGMSIWRDREGNNYWIDQNNHTKTQTLLLRRSPDSKLITVAGGAFGHTDGKGTAARFSTVGGLAFGPDGNLYIADGTSVRKVSMDGTVVTVANQLDARTKDDKPILFSAAYGSLAGVAVDSATNVYVADAGNRRLFRINRDGKADILLRTEPPYFPNGVAISPSGDIYVLEVGFTLPSSWSGPRVRKITPEGRSTILATVGADSGGGSLKASVARTAGASTEGFLSLFLMRERRKYGALLVGGIILVGATIWWRVRRKRQRV